LGTAAIVCLNPSSPPNCPPDNFAEVQVNGSVVGSVGSVTDGTVAGQAIMQLTTFDLGGYLVEGSNVITIVGQNGPSSWAGCPGACTYTQNPAGIIFGGTLTSN
jgi:hypothetical protein